MLQNLLRTLNSFSKTTVLLICCCCLGCGNGEKEIDDPDRPDRPDGDEYEDIEVVDGKVRFYLSESENGIRRPMGVGERVWNESKVTVNGKPYAIATDENDRRYIDVAASNAGTYNATLTTTESGSWYDTSVYTDVKLPYSQFWTTTAQALQSYPMYGSYTKENGNKLIFDDAFAVLDVALTGSAEIASVKVASPDEEIVAGFANYLPSRGGFSMTEGVDFAVLNCTDDGRCVALDKGTPKHFHIMLAPGDYPTGLEITVGDAEHRAMKHTLASLQLAAGEVYTVDLAYTPDADLVFYEGFDNFVWGGDIMADRRRRATPRRPKPLRRTRERTATVMRTPSNGSPTTNPGRPSSSRIRGMKSTARRSARRIKCPTPTWPAATSPTTPSCSAVRSIRVISPAARGTRAAASSRPPRFKP